MKSPLHSLSLKRGGLLILSGILYCLPLHAESKAEHAAFYMTKPGFANLVMTIAKLNRAMRLAAENPMDKFRRSAVRKQIIALPPAIMGLASEFKSGSLHDNDLPIVQSILGGFIDTNAATGYEKFLKNPQKSLIPQVGTGFPQVAVQDSEGYEGGNQLTLDPKDEKGGTQQITSASSLATQNPEIVSLSNVSTTSENSLTKSPVAKTSLILDEKLETGSTQKKQKSVASLPESAISASANNSGNKELERVLSASESMTNKENPSGQFTETSVATTSETPAQQALSLFGGEATPSNKLPRASSKGVTSGVLNDLAVVEEMITEEASDEEEEGVFELDAEKWEADGSKAIPTENKDLNEIIPSEKTEHKKQKKGLPDRLSKTNFERIHWKSAAALRIFSHLFVTQAKAEIAEALGQIAGSIAGAVAQVETTRLQTEADKAIAKIGADAAIQQTEIQADTTLQLADNQKEVALFNTQTTKEIVEIQQNNANKRLRMQLAALREERIALQKEQAAIRAIEQYRFDQQLQFAKEQAAENQKLAKATLNAQLVQAGLSTGLTSTNSGASLGVNSILSGSGNTASLVTGTRTTLGIGTPNSAPKSRLSVNSLDGNLLTSLDRKAVASLGPGNGRSLLKDNGRARASYSFLPSRQTSTIGSSIDRDKNTKRISDRIGSALRSPTSNTLPRPSATRVTNRGSSNKPTTFFSHALPE